MHMEQSCYIEILAYITFAMAGIALEPKIIETTYTSRYLSLGDFDIDTVCEGTAIWAKLEEP